MIAGDPAGDFFEQNPTLKYKSEFVDLIVSHGPERASRIAWAVWMVESPDSPMFRIPIDERIEEVAKNYEVDVRAYKSFREKFKKIVLTKEEMLFKIHMEKLDELTMKLNDLDLDDNANLKQYIQIMDKLPKIYAAMDKIKKDMIDVRSKDTVYGGGKLGARERL